MPPQWTKRRRGVIGLAALSLLGSALVGLPPDVTAAAAPPARPHPLTRDQALAQAKRTHAPVEVTGSTTANESLMANPDGTLTFRQSVLPVRKLVEGTWKALDATLSVRPDGTVSPAIAAGTVVLSGGGGGPLARLGDQGRSLAFGLPVTLPAPVLSGPTALYREVLPDVDLRVTVSEQGGFSEVLIVKSAKGAANPLLRQLKLSTTADGVTLSTDAVGNVTGRDRLGQVALSAPQARMWDSGPALGAAPVGMAAESSDRGPGAYARRALLRTTVDASGITLAPDATLLDGTGVTWPLYIDPSFSWTPMGSGKTGWATVSRGYAGNDYSNSNYWNNTPDPDGRMQVGNSNWTSTGIWSRSLVNFKLDTSTLAGATINSAVVDTTLVHSWSCSPREVNIYAPADTLAQSNAYWNWWNGRSWGSVVDHKNVAAGYTGCTNAVGVAFNVKSTVLSNTSAHKDTQTYLLAAANETDYAGYKEFTSNPTLTVTYNHAPTPPTGLSTSPATSCSASPPSAVGDGAVTLYAPVSDPEGNQLGVKFELWETSASGTILAWSDPNLLTYASGTTAVFTVPEATLKNAAGSSLTQFSWHVQTTDGNLTSPWSATCAFSFDTSRTGAPSPTQDAAATIGQDVGFTIAPPSGGTAPTSYLYQLNGGAPATVAAQSPTTPITVKPTRFTNVLTVSSLSAGGNVGDTASVVFNASPAATAASDDLTGDNVADLLTVGGLNNVPAGVWLATGRGGKVNTTAVNIGAKGNGVNGDDLPADFTGAKVISGHFTGTGLQDLLVYYPTGANAGGGVILNGPGDGSVIQAQSSGNESTLSAGLFVDNNGYNPVQVANAGDSSHRGLAYPDLITVNGTTGSSYLTYYPNQNSVIGFPFAVPLTTTTPAGDMAWNTWIIATTQLSTGTAMYLWKPTTGALYLWKDLSFSDTTGLSYVPYIIKASGWNTNLSASLQAADINADGTPDLWTVGANGAATAHLVTNITGTPTVTAQPVQTLITGNHAWKLDDQADGAAASAADSVATSALTGSGNVQWHTGDLYSPDVLLNADATGSAPDPAGTGSLASGTTPIIDTTKSFTLSVWVKTMKYGGIVASEDGAHSARFILYPDGASKQWYFGMSTSDTTAWSYDLVHSTTPVQLGVWTHLAATWNSSTGTMSLYVDGALQPTGQHTVAPAWPSTGAFRLGSYLYNNAQGDYFAGQIAEVQTWNQSLAPGQVSFKAHANGDYVCADYAGADPLIANRTVIGFWETFDLIDLGGGNIALRSHANGKYVTADNAGASALIANRTAIGAWETFQLISNADGSIALKAGINGMYVTAESAGASALIANRTAIGLWEEFDLIEG